MHPLPVESQAGNKKNNKAKSMSHFKNNSGARFSLSCVMLLTALSLSTTIQAQNADPAAVFELLSTSDGSTITARHESGSVVINNQLYAFGGRQTRPVEKYDPATNQWTMLGTPPYEIHHFQPVFHNGKVYAIGAFDCCYPQEVIHPNVRLYDVASDSWSDGPLIPPARLRGSAGAVKYNNKIYLLGGNTLGHNGGAVSWFDEFDPATNSWQTLPDAPSARDHFFATMVGDKLVAASGRQTSLPNPFAGTVSTVDIYDFDTGQWSTESAIPTPRAGAMTVTYGAEAIYIGGEVGGMTSANTEVEAFNPFTGVWRSLQALMLPMHTGVAGVLGDALHVISGSDVQGGGGENNLHQVAELDDGVADPMDADADGLTDLEEENTYLTDRLKADTDGDGLDDGVEVNVHNSDPNKTDSDDDGLEDFEEVTAGTNINDVDTDSDGLSDGDEVSQYQTDPLSSDSDADFLPDDHEILLHGTDPNESDTDSDGVSDSDEINVYNTNPLVADTDTDGASDGDELAAGLNPLLPDTDGDGITDDEELDGDVEPQSGGSDTGETGAGDTDAGETDTDEVDADGTDPVDTNTTDTESDNESDANTNNDTDSAEANSSSGGSGGGSFSLLTGLLMLLTLALKMVAAGRRRTVSLFAAPAQTRN